jgi:toxin FitB
MLVSEPAKPTPHAAAVAWLGQQAMPDLAISVLTIGEIARGIRRMPEGRRRRDLEKWLSTALPAQFQDRILPVDRDVAQAWGELTAQGDADGRPLPVVDGLLLATAKVNGLTIATRNVAHFHGRSVPLLDPYAGQL